MRYDAHEILVAPARASRGLLRLLGGVGLSLGLFVVLSYGYSQALPRFFSQQRWEEISSHIELATSPAAVLINLFVFGVMILALSIAVRVMHRRGIGTVIGPIPLAFRQFFRALFFLLMLYAVVAFLPLPETVQPVPNLAPGMWIVFLPLAVLGLFLQVFAEELVFRGYLQSQLAARFSSPLIWLCLPAAAFAILHYEEQSYGGQAWAVVVWTGLFALAAGDLTARFGTLGPATALHFVNNFSAIMIAAPQGRFDGLALYVYPVSLQDAQTFWMLMPIDIAVLVCGWLCIRVGLRG